MYEQSDCAVIIYKHDLQVIIEIDQNVKFINKNQPLIFLFKRLYIDRDAMQHISTRKIFLVFLRVEYALEVVASI